MLEVVGLGSRTHHRLPYGPGPGASPEPRDDEKDLPILARNILAEKLGVEESLPDVRGMHLEEVVDLERLGDPREPRGLDNSRPLVVREKRGIVVATGEAARRSAVSSGPMTTRPGKRSSSARRRAGETFGTTPSEPCSVTRGMTASRVTSGGSGGTRDSSTLVLIPAAQPVKNEMAISKDGDPTRHGIETSGFPPSMASFLASLFRRGHSARCAGSASSVLSGKPRAGCVV